MRRPELQDTIRSVIKIFNDYFMSPALDQNWLYTQFGQLATDRVVKDTNEAVLSFRVFTQNKNLKRLSPEEQQAHINEYVNALVGEPSHELHKCYTRLANDLVINLYCYGIDFFVSPYEEPALLQQFARQYQAIVFRALDEQFSAFLSEDVKKTQYFYAITGRSKQYAFKEFSFTQEASTLLKNFFKANPSMRQWILKNFTSLIAVIKEFNTFRLKSHINPLFVFLRDDENFTFMLQLFGEWGSQLPLMPHQDLSRLTPFIEFLTLFRADVPPFIQSRLHSQVRLCSTKDPQQGRLLMIDYLQSEKLLLKRLITQIEQLRLLSALYFAYQAQALGLTTEAISGRPALQFFAAPRAQTSPVIEVSEESAKRARLA